MMDNNMDAIEVTIQPCEKTGLPRKAIVCSHFVDWGVSNGVMIKENQCVNIYFNIITYGEGSKIITELTKDEQIKVKYGTEDFNTWFDDFHTDFSQKVASAIESYLNL